MAFLDGWLKRVSCVVVLGKEKDTEDGSGRKLNRSVGRSMSKQDRERVGLPVQGRRARGG